MSRSHSTVIDLTEESPPARTHARPPTLGTDTHILDWSSSSRADRSSSHSNTLNFTSSASGTGPFRHAGAPIVVGSDDEDDDHSFSITGASEPVRSSTPLQRSFSTGMAYHRPSAAPTASASSVRFHDGIGRGPHGFGPRIPQSVNLLSSLSSSPSARHPLLPQRRAAIPSATTTTARRTNVGGGGGGGGGTTTGPEGFLSRLTADFSLGGLAMGSYPLPHEMLSSLIRGLRPGMLQQSSDRKVPQEYDPKWTHPYDAQPGFTHSIIEPPVDLDTYFDDKAVVTGPLPDTTPICPCCRHALVTGANGDQRIWVLPCGHVIDGRCVDQLSGLTPPPSSDGASDTQHELRKGKGKGKGKAIEAAQDEPPAKVPRTSARMRATAAVAEPKDTTPKKPKKPKRFECPVQGCGQKCSKEAGSKYSAWEVFV